MGARIRWDFMWPLKAHLHSRSDLLARIQSSSPASPFRSFGKRQEQRSQIVLSRFSAIVVVAPTLVAVSFNTKVRERQILQYGGDGFGARPLIDQTSLDSSDT